MPGGTLKFGQVVGNVNVPWDECKQRDVTRSWHLIHGHSKNSEPQELELAIMANETDAEKSARHEKTRITKVSGPHLAALEATRLPAITGRAVRDIMAECADIAASARCVRCVCVWKWGEAGRHLDCYQRDKSGRNSRYFVSRETRTCGCGIDPNNRRRINRSNVSAGDGR